jgi:uncharacterized membrane protein
MKSRPPGLAVTFWTRCIPTSNRCVSAPASTLGAAAGTGTDRPGRAGLHDRRRDHRTTLCGCHAEHPIQSGFAAAPKGYRFDTPARIRTQAQEIGRQVATGAMPLGKLTTMTEDERAAVVAWINAGAPP